MDFSLLVVNRDFTDDMASFRRKQWSSLVGAQDQDSVPAKVAFAVGGSDVFAFPPRVQTARGCRQQSEADRERSECFGERTAVQKVQMQISRILLDVSKTNGKRFGRRN